MLRSLFNEWRWGRGALDALEVVIRHRGAPADERVVSGAVITALSAQGFHVAPSASWLPAESGTPDAVFVPWHRVLRVRGPDGELFRKPGEEAP